MVVARKTHSPSYSSGTEGTAAAAVGAAQPVSSSSSSLSSTSTMPQTSKERHYAQLAGRLALLSQNVIDLHGHIETVAEHSMKTRVLAANQASLFMAANAQELDRPNLAYAAADAAAGEEKVNQG